MKSFRLIEMSSVKYYGTPLPQTTLWPSRNILPPPPIEAPNAPIPLAWKALDVRLAEMDISKREQLAANLLNKPEGMIRNVDAVETLRRVLYLMPGSELNDEPRVDWAVWGTVMNAPGCNNLLPLGFEKCAEWYADGTEASCQRQQDSAQQASFGF